MAVGLVMLALLLVFMLFMIFSTNIYVLMVARKNKLSYKWTKHLLVWQFKKLDPGPRWLALLAGL